LIQLPHLETSRDDFFVRGFLREMGGNRSICRHNMRSVLRTERITENDNFISPQRAVSSTDSAIVSHSLARRGQDVICYHVDDARPKVNRGRWEILVKREVVNRASDAVLDVPIMQPTVRWRAMILVIAIAISVAAFSASSPSAGQT
jgi:hypothetical protein